MRNAFARTAASITAAVVTTMLAIVADGLIIGRFLGADCMAAYSLATPIINLTTIFSGVLSTGAEVMCAHHLGAGRPDRARRVFSMCMVATVVVSVTLLAVVVVFRADIATLLGARGESAYLLPYTADYLLGLAPSLPAMICLFEFNVLLRLDNDTRRVMAGVLVMTVLDIGGDLVNVHVVHGGMLGMGLASSISYAVAFAIMATHFAKKDIVFRFSVRGLRASDLRDILVTGSSSAVGSASAMLRNLTMNRILAASALSSLAIGAFGVMNTVLGFASCLLIGIGLTAAMFAGEIAGAGSDRAAAAELVRVTCRTALLVGAVLGVVVFVGADAIAAVFGNAESREMTELAARALRFYAASLVLYGINNAFISYTQGMRRMAYSNVFCFLQNYAFVALPALALSGVLGADAAWVSFPIGEALTFAGIVGLATYLKKGVPSYVDDFLFLKEGEAASGQGSQAPSASDQPSTWRLAD